jgi:benzoyl-CoA-dihydrodiol lyase
VQWRLVDETVPLSRFAQRVPERAKALGEKASARSGPGVELKPLGGTYDDNGIAHRYVTLAIDAPARVATLTMRGPEAGEPTDAAGMRAKGSDLWSLRAFRELDDVLLDLRFNRPEIGVVVLRTEGDIDRVLAADQALAANEGDWFASEVRHFIKRTLKRLDLTARSLIAVIDQGSCFAGSLFELALAADRTYMLDVDGGPEIALGALSRGALPMSNGLSRLHTPTRRRRTRSRRASA